MFLSDRIVCSYHAALLETKPGEQIQDISQTFCQELNHPDKAELRAPVTTEPVNNCRGHFPQEPRS